MIQIYVGPTGCGKTYQAFHRLNKKARAMYLAPCRQLVYESAMKYGNSKCSVSTSDLKMGNVKNSHISFRTYEACKEEDINNVDVLIIDEAHFMSDYERGQHLKNLVFLADKKGKKVILLSATLNFRIKGAKVIRLAPRGENFIRREVTYDEAISRMKAGVPTLIFHKRRIDCGQIASAYSMRRKCGIITADTSIEDRIRLVDLYNRGKITVIEATNAMAQGVNVPCENLICLYNDWDEDSVIVQKFGRLGRTGVTREDAELTYYMQPAIDDEYNETPINIKDISFSIKTERGSKSLKIEYKNCTPFDRDLRNPSTKKEIEHTKARIEKAWHKL